MISQPLLVYLPVHKSKSKFMSLLQGNLFDVFNPDIVELKMHKSISRQCSASQSSKNKFAPKLSVIPVPTFNIWPSKVVSYYAFPGSIHNEKSDSNLKQNNSDGLISRKASIRIKNAISWLNHLSKWSKVQDKKLNKKFAFRLNFITLTLPSPQILYFHLPDGSVVNNDHNFNCWSCVNLGFMKPHYVMTDKAIKDICLNQFLTELRTKYHVKHYVWRAEAQKNGNIHFHITMNKFVYLGDLRNMWNRILDKTPFIDNYSKKFSKLNFENYCKIADPLNNKSTKKLLKSYEFGVRTHWRSPNSTDIHSVKNIRNIEGYLSEYFSKIDNTRRLIQGYLWRLSESLSALRCASVTVDSDLDSEFTYFSKVFKEHYKIYDHAQIIYEPLEHLFQIFARSRICDYFQQYKEKIFQQLSLKLIS